MILKQKDYFEEGRRKTLYERLEAARSDAPNARLFDACVAEEVAKEEAGAPLSRAAYVRLVGPEKMRMHPKKVSWRSEGYFGRKNKKDVR